MNKFRVIYVGTDERRVFELPYQPDANTIVDTLRQLEHAREPVLQKWDGEVWLNWLPRPQVWVHCPADQ